MKRAAFVAVLLAVALSAVACRKPTEGEPCRAIGEATCIDATHVRVCRGYAWHVDTCRGPVGCTGTAGHAVCDARRADECDGCGERGKTSCTRDGSALLE